MLSTGVDRVVEQVINPKIHKVFKDQLDRAVCDYLGINFDHWEEKLRTRDELRQQIQHLEQQKQQQQLMAQNSPQKSKLPQNDHNDPDKVQVLFSVQFYIC
jgi:hypothetical protein